MSLCLAGWLFITLLSPALATGQQNGPIPETPNINSSLDSCCCKQKCLHHPSRKKKRGGSTAPQPSGQTVSVPVDPPAPPLQTPGVPKAQHDPNQVPVQPTKWDEGVVKTLASSGFSLVSLSFAAFTFLYGTLVGLRPTNPDPPIEPNSKLQNQRRRIGRTLYAVAGTVLMASAITLLANVAVAFSFRWAGLLSIFLAMMLLLVVSAIPLYLLYDLHSQQG
jgi:hypothetical protein